MTIQEYLKIAVHGYPKEELNYYKPYFLHMDCEHCIYKGFACKEPKIGDVCIDYRVERKHKEFKIQTNRKDVSKWESEEGMR
jgi:hypothetical protein